MKVLAKPLCLVLALILSLSVQPVARADVGQPPASRQIANYAIGFARVAQVPRYGGAITDAAALHTTGFGIGPDVTGMTRRGLMAVSLATIWDEPPPRLAGAVLRLQQYEKYYAPVPPKDVPKPPELWSVDVMPDQPRWGSQGRWTQAFPLLSKEVDPRSGQVTYAYDISSAYLAAHVAGGKEIIVGVKSGDERDVNQSVTLVPSALLTVYAHTDGAVPYLPEPHFHGEQATEDDEGWWITAGRDTPLFFSWEVRNDVDRIARMEGPAGALTFTASGDKTAASVNVPEGDYQMTAFARLMSDPNVKSEVTAPVAVHAIPAPGPQGYSVRVDGAQVTVTAKRTGSAVSARLDDGTQFPPYPVAYGPEGEATISTTFPKAGTHTLKLFGINRARGDGEPVTISVTTDKSAPYPERWANYRLLNTLSPEPYGPRVPLLSESPPVFVTQEYRPKLKMSPTSSFYAPGVVDSRTHAIDVTVQGELAGASAASPSCTFVSLASNRTGEPVMGYGIHQGVGSRFLVSGGQVTWKSFRGGFWRFAKSLTIQRTPTTARMYSFFDDENFTGLEPVQGNYSLLLGASTIAGQKFPSCEGTLEDIFVLRKELG